MQGAGHSWGVASFSYDGKLVGETPDGSISSLTNQLSSTERKDISDKMTDYRTKNPKCSLKSEKIVEFLEGLGTTTEGQLVFAKKIP